MSGLSPDVLAIIELFAPLFTESVWQRARPADWDHPYPGSAYGGWCVAGDGTERGEAVQELPPGTEPGALVGVGEQTLIVGDTDSTVCAEGYGGDGDR